VSNVVKVDLNRPMNEILAQLTKYPVRRNCRYRHDGRGARYCPRKAQRESRSRRRLAAVFKRSSGYYAGPAKTPKACPPARSAPTTAGRMDSYVDLFQSLGGSMITLAKRQSQAAGHRRVQKVRRLLSWLYRWSGGDTGERNIKKVDVLEYPD